jgi:lipopolysaccharide/colanic/teichoic acid biosynthesis glycosyltransferase
MQNSEQLEILNIEYLGPLPEKKDTWLNRYYPSIKRFNDIFFSAVVLLFSLPLLIFLAILIKLDSRGPVFYIQERATKDGKLFNLYKLRTMTVDADKVDLVTHQNDPRITRVGKLIRKLSIDELPQIINILKGDMSFVGPRAQPTKFMEQWKSEGILEVKPGILGWAMLHGREELPYEDRFKLEREYITNFCWETDSFIVFTTLKKFEKVFYWVLIPFFVSIIILIGISFYYFYLK